MPTLACPQCRKSLEDDGSLGGQLVQCPACSAQFTWPAVHAVPVARAIVPDEFAVRHVYHHAAPSNPGLAAILSFFWPGLGQIYNGAILVGMLCVLFHVVFALASFILIGIPFLIGLWVWSIYDAYTSAEAVNRYNARRR